MRADDAWFLSCLNITLGLALYVSITRFRADRVLSPVGVTLLVLVSIFGVRPLFLIADRNYDFHGLDSALGYPYASLVGTVSVVAVATGFYVRSSRRTPVVAHPSRAFSPLTNVKDGENIPGLWPAFAIAVLATSLWLVVIMLVGGGPAFLVTLFQGRSEVVTDTLAGVPVALGSIPIVGAILLCYTRMKNQAIRKITTDERLIYWLGIATAVVPPLALGTRRYLLPAVVAGALAVLAARGRGRVSIRSVVLSVLVFIVLAVVPYTRSSGARQDQAGPITAIYDYLLSQNLTNIARSVFVSYDTEMYNYIAYVAPRLGSSIGYGYGRGTIVELFVGPLPASWGIPTYSDELLVHLYGRTCGEGVCPVASLPGTLAFDGGLLAVALGMFLFGLWCGVVTTATIVNSRPVLGIVFLVLSAFTVVIVRGNPITSLTIAAYTSALSWIGWHLLVRFAGTNNAGTRAANNWKLVGSE